MYIGEVAKQTGLTIKAIRFYEEKGLIPAPKRLGRYRVYTPSDIEVLVLIKEAKELGMTLSQLKNLIQYQGGKVDWKRINTSLQVVKKELKNEIKRIERKIQLIDQCMGQINS